MRLPLRALALVVVLALPVALFMAADIPVVPVAEAQLEALAAREIEAESVDVDLTGFPIVARALAKGEIPAAVLRWNGATLGEIRDASLQMRLQGVGLNRSGLLQGEVHIEGVESGEIEMQIPISEISRILDREVRIDSERVMVTVTPTSEVPAQISASASALVLTAGTPEPVVAEFDPRVMPCAPRVEIEGNRLLLRCSFRGLPPLLRS